MLLTILAALSWGLSTVFAKVALSRITAVDLVGIEISVGIALLCPVAALRLSRSRRPQPGYALLGLLQPGLSFPLLDTGLSKTTATSASILLGCEILFVLPFARAVLGERPSQKATAAVLAGFAGSVLVSLAPGGARASVGGDALVIAASGLGAMYVVYARKLAPEGDWAVITATQLLAAGVCVSPVIVAAVAAGDSRLSRADPAHIACALAAALLTTVIPFALYNAAVAHINATSAATILCLVPLFGAVASLLVLGGGIGVGQVVGGSLVVGAAVITIRAVAPVGGA